MQTEKKPKIEKALQADDSMDYEFRQFPPFYRIMAGEKSIGTIEFDDDVEHKENRYANITSIVIDPDDKNFAHGINVGAELIERLKQHEYNGIYVENMIRKEIYLALKMLCPDLKFPEYKIGMTLYLDFVHDK